MLVHQLNTSQDLSYQQTATLSPRNSACALNAFLLRFLSFLHFCVFAFLFLLRVFSFSFSFFFGCTSAHRGFAPGIIWLQVIRDGTSIPQLVSIVPFAHYVLVLRRCTYFIPRIYFFVFSPIKNASACFVTTGQSSGKLT